MAFVPLKIICEFLDNSNFVWKRKCHTYFSFEDVRLVRLAFDPLPATCRRRSGLASGALNGTGLGRKC